MVRHRDRGHAEVDGFFYECVEGIRPVEEAVLGVEMQMNEIGVMHNGKASSKFQATNPK